MFRIRRDCSIDVVDDVADVYRGWRCNWHESLGKCPGLIFEAAIDAYKAISLHIRQIFGENIPIIEPLSLDESYLDVTENLKGINSAIQICDGTGCLDQFPGGTSNGLVARAPSLRARGAVCLLAWTQPAAHCASFPIGPPAAAPRSAVRRQILDPQTGCTNQSPAASSTSHAVSGQRDAIASRCHKHLSKAIRRRS